MIGTMYQCVRSQCSSIRLGLKARRKKRKMYRRMSDVPLEDLKIIEQVKPYTMVGPERLHAFMHATRYVVKNQIPGAVVECGVWRGGAVMTSIRTLQSLGVDDREVYLYDTFEGMPQPTEHDRKSSGLEAAEKFQLERIDNRQSNWCRAEYDFVRQIVLGTGYQTDRIRFVKGLVEETIPETVPDQIAILRLDTDWYESTKHELECLFPRLVRGGVLILDDYGCWLGARKATDEYFAEHSIPMLLNRTDTDGRIGVKL